MGNPCTNGPGGAAPTDKITVTGNIPPAFREALAQYRKEAPNVEETQINFLNERLWTGRPVTANPLPAEQKVGERRHPDCVNWTKAGFHKSPPKDIDWNTPIKMGFGEHPLASPTAVIPRSFRFTVETDVDSKFQYYVENADIDWKKKQIKMSLYENKDFDVDSVVRAYDSEKCSHPMTFMLYDGCGNKLMAYRFHGVAVHTYSTPFDYASSDIHGPKVVFQYKSVERLKNPTK